LGCFFLVVYFKECQSSLSLKKKDDAEFGIKIDLDRAVNAVEMFNVGL